MKAISVTDIQNAHQVMKQVLTETPLIKNEWLSKLYRCEVYLKLETMQPIGSFKIRGATYKISKLSDGDRKKATIVCHQRAVFLKCRQHRFFLFGPVGGDVERGFQANALSHRGNIGLGRGGRRGVVRCRINIFFA